MAKETIIKKISRYIRYLFGKCSYCGNLIRKGGGRKWGGGVAHPFYKCQRKNKISNKYACLKCEMMFDDD